MIVTQHTLASPISPDEPCGPDLSHADGFTFVKAAFEAGTVITGEIDQQRLREGFGRDGLVADESLIVSSEGTDWGQVADVALTSLESRSKDLRMSGYLALALARKDGIPGLTAGLGINAELIETFGSGLLPVRQRAKDRAIQFLVSGAVGALEVAGPVDVSVGAGLAEEASRYVDLAASISSVATTPLQEAVRRLLQRSASPEPAATLEATTSPALPSTPVTIDGLVDAMRMDNPDSGIPVRLSRILAWDAIQRIPRSSNGRLTSEAPPAARHDYLGNLMRSESWEELAGEAERSFKRFPLWLDLQWFALTAATSLGRTTVEKAIADETVRFLARFPELAQLDFGTGGPVAGPQTRLWLDSLEQKTVADGQASEALEVVDPEQEARSRLLKGESLSSVLAGLSSDSATHGEARFERLNLMVQLASSSGRDDIAAALLGLLSETIDYHRLDKWRPDMATKVWLQRLEEPDLPLSVRNELFQRVCNTDPSMACKAAQRGGGHHV